MPGAEVLLALNHSSPAARPGLDTPQARAVTAILDPLQARRIAIPFCGAQALPAFAASGRTFHEILRATPEQLMRWSGRGELSALSAQAHLAAWWRAIVDQVSAVWAFAAPNR